MLKLITVIMNPTDEGALEKQFPQDFEYSLEKCKQPSITTTKINQENSCLLATWQMINSSNNTYVGMVHINAANTWEIKIK